MLTKYWKDKMTPRSFASSKNDTRSNRKCRSSCNKHLPLRVQTGGKKSKARRSVKLISWLETSERTNETVSGNPLLWAWVFLLIEPTYLYDRIVPDQATTIQLLLLRSITHTPDWRVTLIKQRWVNQEGCMRSSALCCVRKPYASNKKKLYKSDKLLGKSRWRFVDSNKLSDVSCKQNCNKSVTTDTV